MVVLRLNWASLFIFLASKFQSCHQPQSPRKQRRGGGGRGRSYQSDPWASCGQLEALFCLFAVHSSLDASLRGFQILRTRQTGWLGSRCGYLVEGPRQTPDSLWLKAVKVLKSTVLLEEVWCASCFSFSRDGHVHYNCTTSVPTDQLARAPVPLSSHQSLERYFWLFFVCLFVFVFLRKVSPCRAGWLRLTQVCPRLPSEGWY